MAFKIGDIVYVAEKPMDISYLPENWNNLIGKVLESEPGTTKIIFLWAAKRKDHLNTYWLPNYSLGLVFDSPEISTSDVSAPISQS